MRDSFRGYYPPSADELNELWSSGSIVLDTNSLLNLYRYSQTTRDEFLTVLTELKERLWVPAQVGLEFQTRRLGVIEEQKSAYGEIRKALDSTRKSFEGQVMRFKRHSSLDAEGLLKKYGLAVDVIADEVTKLQKSHENILDRGFPHDDIWDHVTELLDGRVGPAFNAAELAAVHGEGSARFEQLIPPGYKDSSKGAPQMYGDLVLWKQILTRSVERKDAAIFVTDDSKEDWWRIEKGQRLGPRPELVDEYHASSGRRIHFYSPEQFLRHAKTRTAVPVSEESLGEVKQVSTQAAERIRAVAERRLVDLQRQYAHLSTVSEREPRQDKSEVNLRRRLVEARAGAQNELAGAQAKRDEYRTWLTTARTQLSNSQAAEMEDIVAGSEEVIVGMTSRLAEIETRLRHMRPIERKNNRASYEERAILIRAEMTEIYEALAETDTSPE